jgi:hypothetical protein
LSEKKRRQKILNCFANYYFDTILALVPGQMYVEREHLFEPSLNEFGPHDSNKKLKHCVFKVYNGNGVTETRMHSEMDWLLYNVVKCLR